MEDRDNKGRFVVGNPGGKGPQPLPAELKAARKYTKARYEAIIHRLSAMSYSELQAFVKDPNADVLELMIASTMAKAIAKGDHKRMECFTDRVVGPVPKNIRVSGSTISDLMEEANKAEAERIAADENLALEGTDVLGSETT